jgi:hypothetical protein
MADEASKAGAGKSKKGAAKQDAAGGFWALFE